MAYFERTGGTTYRATEHVSGAWDTGTQHIAPAMGLLVHLVETDRHERSRDDLVIGRLSYDILGTAPVGDVTTAVRVVRPGRTVELVEAIMSHAGRDVLLLRAWLLQAGDTTTVAGGDVPGLPRPEDLPAWDPSSVWPGGFIASAEVRRRELAPGRAAYWVRTDVPLLAGEQVAPLAAMAGLFDIANGMTVRTDPAKVAFPNLDLTAHLHRQPAGDWLGFDTTVTFGPGGLGLTSSTLHDIEGPVGALNQALTVRPG